MNSNRRWLGWVAIGVGALVLLAAIFGQGFGPMAMAAGARQGYAQQAPAQQAPAQPGNVQQDHGRGGDRQQSGQAAPQGGMERGRPQAGRGSWLSLPFGPAAFKLGMLALLAVAGVWLLRGRKAPASTQQAGQAESPAQAPLSPTGEAYIEEPGEAE